MSPPSSPSPRPSEVGPLTRVDVEARLRWLVPGLTLEPEFDDRLKVLGVGVTGDFATTGRAWLGDGPFESQSPLLMLRPAAHAGLGGASVGLVALFASPAEREAVQGGFGPMSISGPFAVINWDGTAHSEWVSVENAIVEIVVTGGTFGGRSPTPEEEAYPGRVRAALVGEASP